MAAAEEGIAVPFRECHAEIRRWDRVLKEIEKVLTHYQQLRTKILTENKRGVKRKMWADSNNEHAASSSGYSSSTHTPVEEGEQHKNHATKSTSDTATSVDKKDPVENVTATKEDMSGGDSLVFIELSEEERTELLQHYHALSNLLEKSQHHLIDKKLDIMLNQRRHHYNHTTEKPLGGKGGNERGDDEAEEDEEGEEAEDEEEENRGASITEAPSRASFVGGEKRRPEQIDLDEDEAERDEEDEEEDEEEEDDDDAEDFIETSLRSAKRQRTSVEGADPFNPTLPVVDDMKTRPLCGAAGAPANYMIPAGSGVAAKVRPKGKQEPTWILASIVRYLPDKHKYEVVDADNEVAEAERKKYMLPRRAIIPLPTSVPRNWTKATLFPKGASVLALYPGTTSFYPATVLAGPRRRKNGNYILAFADEERENGQVPKKQVPPRFVIHCID
ncbi:death domain-associated protein 6-like isoform X1 [Balamuthia mandrillaris]